MKAARGLAAFVLAVALLACGGVDAAFAGSWKPAEASLGYVSTDFTVTFAGKEDKCVMAGSGTLAKESATWTSKPSFSACTFTTKAGKSWTMKDVNKEEGKIEIGKGKGEAEAALVITVSAECHVLAEEAASLGTTGDYANGANGFTEPSGMTLSNQVLIVAQSPKECAGKGTEAAISASVAFLNLTNEELAIDLS